MKSYDLLENITVWTSIYRDSTDSDKVSDKWKNGMLRVISVLQPCEELDMTPFKARLESAIDFAKTKDTSKIQEIFLIMDELEKHLGEHTEN